MIAKYSMVTILKENVDLLYRYLIYIYHAEYGNYKYNMIMEI